MNLFCKLGLHLYKDSVSFDYLNATFESVPCVIREKCEICGKIRNEVKGVWINAEKENVERNKNKILTSSQKRK